MEKGTPISPKIGEISEARKRASHVLQEGSPGEFLQRRLGEPKNQQAGEGSPSLAQWEVQWQQFLQTLENPQSGWGVPPLPEKPSPWEDAKAFLASFEQVAKACQWPQEEWATRLLPALIGEAQQAFNRLNVRDREDYGKVKVAILRGDALSQEKQRQRFRGFCFLEAEGPRGAYSRLREMCCQWLRVENHSKEEILELLILEQLLSVLPPEIQSRVRECGPESCSQAVALAEELLRQERQVPLEEAARSISEAGQDPSESEWRHLSIYIIDEEGRETSLLAGSTDEMSVEFPGSSLENAEEEDSEGNYRDLGGIKRKEGTDTGKKREKHIPFQGGGFHEIPVQAERSIEDFTSKQRIHCREKENESLSAGKAFNQKRSIVSQEQIHSGGRPYNCSECGKSFSRQAALTSHQRIHSGGDEENEEDKELRGLLLEKAKNQQLKGNLNNQDGPRRQRGNHLVEKRDEPSPCQGGDFCEVIYLDEETYKCLECRMDFSDHAQYNTHLQKHCGRKTPKCLECGKSFRCRSELLRHQRVHTAGNAYICSPCGKCFSRIANLIQHQRIHSDEKPLICSGGGRNFSDGKKNNARFPEHNRKKAYKCVQCGKNFSQNYHLQQHERTHTAGKPFECSECGKRFSESLSLKQHERTHSREKPFECSECGKSFQWNSNFKQHQRIHTGEKPFECSECGKKFSRNDHLQRHRRTHTGKNHFECSECGKRFSESLSLKRHSRTHTGGKPFECSECGKSFQWNSKLQQHQRTHTTEKPFECSECGRSFKWSSDRRRHQRRTHMKRHSNAASF